ncbi:MAG: nucleoside hydrolase [Christensenellales bacterium]
MKTIPVILDVDTGTDDAVALAFASYLPNLDVKLIATGGGNTSVENVTKNTLNILQFINKGCIGVAKGRGESLSKHSLSLQVHGKTGLGDYDFDKLRIRALKLSAVEAIHLILSEESEKITLIALGPATNFAELIKLYPEDKNKIDRIVFSGGLIETLDKDELPYTSFNVAHDPEAFKVLQNSGIDLCIVPSNLGHDAFLDWQDVFKTKTTNSTGAMFEELFRSYHDRHVKNGIATHDLCAVYFVSNPEIYSVVNCNCYVEFDKRVDAGILKFNFDSNEPNCKVAKQVNLKKFKKLYFKTLKRMP